MSLLDRLKRFLGLNGAADWEADDLATVTVEREPEEREPTDVTEAAPNDSTPTTEEVDETTNDEQFVSPDSDESEPVTVINGIGPTYADRLNEVDISTVADLAGKDAEQLSGTVDIPLSRLDQWISAADDRVRT